MRIAAAAAAGEIGDPVIVSHLKALLADPHTEVQKTAARALRQIEVAENLSGIGLCPEGTTGLSLGF